jgi:outer membrane DcaP-like protein
VRTSFFAAALLGGTAATLAAQAKPESKFEIYGFAMADAGYSSKQGDPAWFDVLRPTKLPSFEDQFGPDGQAFFSVRQTRFGVKTENTTKVGTLKTQFEFELFGVGVDAGQTTIRLRHAYGELGQFGAGQYWSPFMDIDVFPNSVEYWGPPGMAFFRNVQVRWMPIKGDSRMTIALERPGASADGGIYADRIELQNVKPRFPYPDLSAEYRRAGTWGYVELAGILRWMEWEDLNDDALDLSGDATGWGVSLSSNIKLGKDVLRLQGVYGEGVENYMNDAPADVGVEDDPGNAVTPIKGVALPLLGIVAFLDHTWSETFASTVGYSSIDIDNSAQQAPSAFNKGQYALANLIYMPVPNVMTVVELQWGDRTNHTDGFTSDNVRVQFSFKYSFAKTF